MTTKITSTIVTVADIFEPNEVLNLSRPDGLAREISAVSFVERRLPSTASWELVVQKAIDNTLKTLIGSQLSDWKWFFFGANNGWITPSVIHRHKKFWGARGTPNISLENKNPPEIKFEHESNIRYGTLAAIKAEEVPVFVEWVRHTQSGFLVLSKTDWLLTEPQVRHCFSSVFVDGESSVDWSQAVSNICDTDTVLVRSSGSFDDPDAAVDLFYDPRFIDSIV